MPLLHRKTFDYSDGNEFRAAFAQRYMALGAPGRMVLFGKPRYGRDDDWFLVTDFDFEYIERLSPGNWAAISEVRDDGWEILLGDPSNAELLTRP